METRDEPQPNPALARAAQDELGSELQDMLAELIDLALIGKHFTWSTVGPGSGSLRAELDELVPGWHELADVVAKRMRAVGCWPDGQAITVFQTTESWGLDPVAAGALSCEETLDVLTGHMRELAMRTRGRINAFGEVDVPSQAILLRVLLALEGQIERLRSQMSASTLFIDGGSAEG